MSFSNPYNARRRGNVATGLMAAIQNFLAAKQQGQLFRRQRALDDEELAARREQRSLARQQAQWAGQDRAEIAKQRALAPMLEELEQVGKAYGDAAQPAIAARRRAVQTGEFPATPQVRGVGGPVGAPMPGLLSGVALPPITGLGLDKFQTNQQVREAAEKAQADRQAAAQAASEAAAMTRLQFSESNQDRRSREEQNQQNRRALGAFIGTQEDDGRAGSEYAGLAQMLFPDQFAPAPADQAEAALRNVAGGIVGGLGGGAAGTIARATLRAAPGRTTLLDLLRRRSRSPKAQAALDADASQRAAAEALRQQREAEAERAARAEPLDLALKKTTLQRTTQSIELDRRAAARAERDLDLRLQEFERKKGQDAISNEFAAARQALAEANARALRAKNKGAAGQLQGLKTEFSGTLDLLKQAREAEDSAGVAEYTERAKKLLSQIRNSNLDPKGPRGKDGLNEYERAIVKTMQGNGATYADAVERVRKDRARRAR